MTFSFTGSGRRPTRSIRASVPTRASGLTTALLLSGVAFGVAVLAGCAGTASPESGAATPTSVDGSTTPVPSAPPSVAGSPGASLKPSPVRPKPSVSGPAIPPPAKDEITLTGRVEKTDIEGGCLVLRVGSRTYQLMGGDPVVLQHGNQVRVVAILRPDISTICQMGPVLDVVSSQPA